MTSSRRAANVKVAHFKQRPDTLHASHAPEATTAPRVLRQHCPAQVARLRTRRCLRVTRLCRVSISVSRAQLALRALLAPRSRRLACLDRLENKLASRSVSFAMRGSTPLILQTPSAGSVRKATSVSGDPARHSHALEARMPTRLCWPSLGISAAWKKSASRAQKGPHVPSVHHSPNPVCQGPSRVHLSKRAVRSVQPASSSNFMARQRALTAHVVDSARKVLQLPCPAQAVLLQTLLVLQVRAYALTSRVGIGHLLAVAFQRTVLQVASTAQVPRMIL